MTFGSRRILVPLDGSRLAECVLPLAADLAGSWPAELVLLHVVEARAPESVHGDPHLTTSAGARRYLAVTAEEVRSPEVTAEARVREPPTTDVPGALASAARELGADLILLCSHGRGGLRDVLLGNVAQQTLARASRPVFLVRPPLPGEERPVARAPWVVALDPRSHGATVPELVRELARRLEIPLHLVTVVPTRPTLTSDLRAAGRVSPSAMASVLELEAGDAAEWVAELGGELERQGLDVTREVRRGDPVDQVARVMGRRGWGVLVVPTHARVGLAGRLQRSFASSIVARVRAPVLLLPLAGRGERHRDGGGGGDGPPAPPG